MTFALSYLCRYPVYMQIIREEVKTVSLSDFAGLQRLPVLKSVLMETMRLFPPVPTGPGRVSPKEGITICDTWIPPNTTIFAPKQTIARCKYYVLAPIPITRTFLQ